ncbi:hypothetical protein PG996_010545 [Apiospora saccharicola]|uniref:Uncharacterized protein n=1 Tax=Apiospora saccharicola TaxID=335842 RepID=A0ABR1UNW5_9PEZI
MAPLTSFPIQKLAAELQIKIYKEAIAQEYATRVVPVLNSTKRIVLTPDVMRDSKFLGLCDVADDVAKSIYDCEVEVIQNNAITTIHLSTKWDIFLVGSWPFTLGINVNSGLFPQSLSSISPSALSKIKKVMEHHLDLEDLVYRPTPKFNRMIYSFVDTCFLRVDHARPTLQTLTAQIGGGPHNQLDLLSHYTNPTIYEERTILEITQGEKEDESGEDLEGSCG